MRDYKRTVWNYSDREFAQLIAGALAYKNEQTQRDKLGQLYHEAYYEGHAAAMAMLGQAVTEGRVFGIGALNRGPSTPLGRALADALAEDDD